MKSSGDLLQGRDADKREIKRLQDDLHIRARQLRKSRAETTQLRRLVDDLIRGKMDLEDFSVEYATLGEPVTPSQDNE